VILALAAAAAVSGGHCVPSRADARSPVAVVDAWTDAWNRRNPEAMRRVITAQGKIDLDGEHHVAGAWLKTVAKDVTRLSPIRVTSRKVAGDVVIDNLATVRPMLQVRGAPQPPKPTTVDYQNTTTRYQVVGGCIVSLKMVGS
jgi:hypothetical protein